MDKKRLFVPAISAGLISKVDCLIENKLFENTPFSKNRKKYFEKALNFCH